MKHTIRLMLVKGLHELKTKRVVFGLLFTLISCFAYAQNGFTESEIFLASGSHTFKPELHYQWVTIGEAQGLPVQDLRLVPVEDSTKYGFPVVHCFGNSPDCFKWVPIDAKAEDVACTTPWHIYQDPRETTITLADLLNYQTECYNDSTQVWEHVFNPTSMFDCAYDYGCVYHWHYGWVTHHMQPTFNGFIEWLTKRKK